MIEIIKRRGLHYRQDKMIVWELKVNKWNKVFWIQKYLLHMKINFLKFLLQLDKKINKRLETIYFQIRVTTKAQKTQYIKEIQLIIFNYLVQAVEIKQIFQKNRHTILWKITQEWILRNIKISIRRISVWSRKCTMIKVSRFQDCLQKMS